MTLVALSAVANITIVSNDLDAVNFSNKMCSLLQILVPYQVYRYAVISS